MNNIEHDSFLDAVGLYCPEPVMLLHVEMRKIKANQVLKVEATDPSTTRDINKFCQFLGHDLILQTEEGGHFFYWIKKKKK
ncbi:sulfurtransferase TusA [Marinomonas sp. PE14-40]|uniref:sulfurtransferase TusA n=1 Tax=Marinomonas sp. PE14-40 TaxID=3060621 RepID=UPI003F66F733